MKKTNIKTKIENRLDDKCVSPVQMRKPMPLQSLRVQSMLVCWSGAREVWVQSFISAKG